MPVVASHQRDGAPAVAGRTGGAKPRILAVGPLPPPHHGVATAMEYLRRASAASPVEVRVLDTSDGRGLSNIGRFEFGNVLRAGWAGLHFLWALIVFRPAAVYLCISQNTLGVLRDLLFLLPARATGRRRIVHLHGSHFRTFYDRSAAWLRWLIRLGLGGAHRVIVLGEELRPLFRGLLPDERVDVVPNGIDLAPFEPLEGAARDGGEPVVLYVGAICRDKGILDLLEALPQVRERVPGTRLVLVGEVVAADAEAIRDLAAHPDLTGAVEFAGVRTGQDKLRLLSGADVFVFPSRNELGEGQPYVVLEAMAAGLPIVATSLGCVPETLAAGAGVVVPPAEPAALASALAQVLGDAAQRARLGRAARERVQARYGLDRWEREMIGIFESVADSEQ
jgi:glycosyltransferase involved in cell wall biosynthesis